MHPQFRNIIVLVIIILQLSAVGVMKAVAQSSTGVNSEDIVDALKPNEPAATRSLVSSQRSSDQLSDEDKEVLKSIPTRGLKIETIKQVGEIIDSNSLPSLDFEVQFKLNSVEIQPTSHNDLLALGKALIDPQLINSRLILSGHTDSSGTNTYNLALSGKRAQAVRKYLLDNFPIEENRLVAIGFGEERLKDTGKPEASENRRVEIVNVGKY